MTKKEKTRELIMSNAVLLFSKYGYHKTTTKAIAQAAGVNEITVFRHFGSKENILQTAMSNAVADSDLEKRINTIDGDTLNEQVENILMLYLELITDFEQLYKIQLRVSEDDIPFDRLKLSTAFLNIFSHFIQTNTDKSEEESQLICTVLIESILGMFTVDILSKRTFTNISIEQRIKVLSKINL